MIFKKLADTDFSKGEKTPAKTVLMIVLGAISLIYLINPTAGIIEFLPDALPFIGNLDEIGATMILLNSLKYFGLDIIGLFNNTSQEKKTKPNNPEYYPPENK